MVRLKEGVQINGGVMSQETVAKVMDLKVYQQLVAKYPNLIFVGAGRDASGNVFAKIADPELVDLDKGSMPRLKAAILKGASFYRLPCKTLVKLVGSVAEAEQISRQVREEQDQASRVREQKTPILKALAVWARETAEGGHRAMRASE